MFVDERLGSLSHLGIGFNGELSKNRLQPQRSLGDSLAKCGDFLRGVFVDHCDRSFSLSSSASMKVRFLDGQPFKLPESVGTSMQAMKEKFEVIDTMLKFP